MGSVLVVDSNRRRSRRCGVPGPTCHVSRSDGPCAVAQPIRLSSDSVAATAATHRVADRTKITPASPRAPCARQAAWTCSRTQPTISIVVAPGVKTLATPSFSSAAMSSSGMMPPPKTTMSLASRSASSSTTRREQGHVRAGEDGEPDDVGVLLDRRLDDLLGRLVQAGVDDLHAGVAQRPRDDLGAAVVAVEPGLGHDDADDVGRDRPCCRSRSRRQSRQRRRHPGTRSCRAL